MSQESPSDLPVGFAFALSFSFAFSFAFALALALAFAFAFALAVRFAVARFFCLSSVAIADSDQPGRSLGYGQILVEGSFRSSRIGRIAPPSPLS